MFHPRLHSVHLPTSHTGVGKRDAGTEMRTEPINQQTKWRSFPNGQHCQLFDGSDQLQLRQRQVGVRFLTSVANRPVRHVEAAAPARGLFHPQTQQTSALTFHLEFLLSVEGSSILH